MLLLISWDGRKVSCSLCFVLCQRNLKWNENVLTQLERRNFSSRTRVEECSRSSQLFERCLKFRPKLKIKGVLWRLRTLSEFQINPFGVTGSRMLRGHKSWASEEEREERREYWTLGWKIRCRWLDAMRGNCQVERKIMSLVVSNLSHCHPQSSRTPWRVALKFNQKRKVMPELFD